MHGNQKPLLSRVGPSIEGFGDTDTHWFWTGPLVRKDKSLSLRLSVERSTGRIRQKRCYPQVTAPPVSYQGTPMSLVRALYIDLRCRGHAELIEGCRLVSCPSTRVCTPGDRHTAYHCCNPFHAHPAARTPPPMQVEAFQAPPPPIDLHSELCGLIAEWTAENPHAPLDAFHRLYIAPGDYPAADLTAAISLAVQSDLLSPRWASMLASLEP